MGLISKRTATTPTASGLILCLTTSYVGLSSKPLTEDVLCDLVHLVRFSVALSGHVAIHCGRGWAGDALQEFNRSRVGLIRLVLSSGNVRAHGGNVRHGLTLMSSINLIRCLRHAFKLLAPTHVSAVATMSTGSLKLGY